MSLMDLTFLFILAGAAGAGLLRLLMLRLATGGTLAPNWLLRLPSTLVMLTALFIGAYLLFFDRASSVPDRAEGQRVILVGRVMEVAAAPDNQHASVYTVEDPTGRLEVATRSHPPQIGALVVVWGEVRDLAGRRVVFANDRLSTF